MQRYYAPCGAWNMGYFETILYFFIERLCVSNSMCYLSFISAINFFLVRFNFSVQIFPSIPLFIIEHVYLKIQHWVCFWHGADAYVFLVAVEFCTMSHWIEPDQPESVRETRATGNAISSCFPVLLPFLMAVWHAITSAGSNPYNPENVLFKPWRIKGFSIWNHHKCLS